MTTSLHEFQAAFVRELLQPPSAAHPASLATQPGFAVYRNTVLLACVDALAANYPTVHQLIGADCFATTARDFAVAAPPRSGVLGDYGAGFAVFLARHESVAHLEYLPAIAELDRCWTESHLGADAPVLVAADLAALSPQALSASRLRPHPAARWISFAAMPIYTLWRRHREARPLDDELAWQGEAALLTRPRGAVVWTEIAPAATLFLASCARGRSFAEAMADMADADTDTDADTGDIAQWLPQLVAVGAFCKVEGDR